MSHLSGQTRRGAQILVNPVTQRPAHVTFWAQTISMHSSADALQPSDVPQAMPVPAGGMQQQIQVALSPFLPKWNADFQ